MVLFPQPAQDITEPLGDRQLCPGIHRRCLCIIFVLSAIISLQWRLHQPHGALCQATPPVQRLTYLQVDQCW